MNNYLAGLKPKKIAVIISALLFSTSTAFTIANAASTPVSPSPYRISLHDKNGVVILDNQQVNEYTIADGSQLSFLHADGTDTVVIVDGKATFDRHGIFPINSSAVHIDSGYLDLGDGSVVNFSSDQVTTHAGRYAISVGLGSGHPGDLATFKAANLSVNVNGAPYTVIQARENSKVILNGLTQINYGISTASADRPVNIASAIELWDASTLDAQNVNIKYADSKAPGTIGDTSVTGFYLRGGKANVTGDVNINLQSGAANALYGIDAKSDAEFHGKTAISLASDNATYIVGVLLKDRYVDDTASTVVLKDVSVNVRGSEAVDGSVYGLRYRDTLSNIAIDNINVKASGKDAFGIALQTDEATESSKVTINNANIALSGGAEAGLYGFNSTLADVTVNNLNVQTQGGKDVFMLYQASGKFMGDVTLGSQQSLESAAGTVYSIFGVKGVTSIENNNKLVAWGRMHAQDNLTLNINAGDRSYIYGDTRTVGLGTINMTLNGDNSRWDLVADSDLTNLTLNDATLNYLPVAQARKLTRAASTFKTLTVNDDYVGNNGNIVMNSQLGDDASPTDRLIVAGNTSGTTNVKVLNAGGAGGLTTDGIELITVAGTSDGEFKQNGRIVAGAYDYTLERGEGTNDKNWYLSSALSPEDPVDPVYPVDPAKPANPTDPIKPVKPQSPRESAIRPEAGLYGMNLQAANTLFNTRLQDRLGETHYVDALTGEKAVTSLWLRNVGGHTRQHDNSGQLDMQANRYVMQLGGDIAQWSSDNADRFHLGLMAGYANQKARAENQRNGKRADSSISGYSVGLYGTWLQDNETHEGAYVDTWAQYSWFNNSVNGRGVDEATKEYDAKGFTASVESGYTWKLADISERNALYIQPKAQVTWMGVKADEHKEANGTRVEGKGDGNIQTRLGVRLYGQGHNQLDDGKDRTFQPFVEANWIHNTKDFGVALNGENVDLTGTRNIGELKAGVEGQLTKNVALWGSVAQQMGDKGYSDTSAMLGVKASF